MSLPTQIFDQLIALGVNPAEVREQFTRGAGAGGQKINKTSSTVVLLHPPTGTTVRMQRERSQSANRALAWEELVKKLADRKKAFVLRAEQEREALRRRNRPKSFNSKKRMIDAKRRRASTKQTRHHHGEE